MSQNDIEEIEVSMADAKKMVALSRSLERLLSNRDFKKVFREEYMEKEAVRLVHLKADPNMQDEESQKSIEQQMDAIGSLAQYIYRVQQLGSIAQKEIEYSEQTLDELRNEAE